MKACGSSRFRFIQVQVQKVAHLRQRWDEFKLGDVDRTSADVDLYAGSHQQSHMAGYHLPSLKQSTGEASQVGLHGV